MQEKERNRLVQAVSNLFKIAFPVGFFCGGLGAVTLFFPRATAETSPTFIHGVSASLFMILMMSIGSALMLKIALAERRTCGEKKILALWTEACIFGGAISSLGFGFILISLVMLSPFDFSFLR